MLTKEQIEQLIYAQIEGALSEGDEVLLQDWKSASPDNESEYIRIVRLLKEQQNYIDDRSKNSAREKVKDQIIYHLRSRNKQIKNWFGYSVAVFIIGIVSNFFILNNASQDIEGFSVSAPKGQMANAVLPDGSKVWLNGNSEITYQYDSKNERRSVELKGEAFFDVVSKDKSPFVVATQIANVKVYGTRFNVREDVIQESLAVTLEEGKVSVLTTEDKVIKSLLPGDYMVVDKLGAVKELKQVQTDYLTSWKEGLYHFRDEELIVIAKKLEEIYNVQIDFKDDGLKTRRFRCVINSENSIVHTLERLQISARISYEIKGTNIYFK
jgi:ferric-dicitrate binding protein FerR (iron transport regulator)